MLHKTRGIVFRIIRYSDTSIIANIYTESFGLRSYLVNGVHGKKAKIKASLFQPLALVEMNVTNREKSTMHRINDVMPVHTWTSIPYDIRKSSVLMFINEMLYKSVREEEANPALFEFISHAVQILDLSSENSANFHLVFLTQLANLLGFSPQGRYSDDTPVFNLAEGCFQSRVPSHVHYMPPETACLFSGVLDINFENCHSLGIQPRQRRELLRKIIEYYQLHISTVKEIKSHIVLEEVMG
jgi:DNA repair protein RecO (recombination protein O)